MAGEILTYDWSGRLLTSFSSTPVSGRIGLQWLALVGVGALPKVFGDVC